MTDTTIPPLRRCCLCGNEYPFTPEYFEARKRNKSGLGTRCHTCNRERGRSYTQTDRGRKANREKMQRYRATPEGREATRRAQRKSYYEGGGRERMAIYHRYYYLLNRDRVLSRDKKYRQRPEVKAHRREYLRDVRSTPAGREKKRLESSLYNHQSHVIERRKEYYAIYWQTPKGCLMRRAMNQKRRAGGGRKFTINEIQILREEADGHCGYCGIFVGDDYHIDHMVPISRGGTNDLENLVIACSSCNLSKSDKTPEEWARVRGW